MEISIDRKSKKTLFPPPPQKKILELKSTITEVKKKITIGIQRQFEQAEVSIREPEDRTMEIIRYEEQKEKKRLKESKQSLWGLWNTIKLIQ